jgi:hypothetical protein
MSCEVAKNDHHQFFRFLVVNHNTGVRPDIPLKFLGLVDIKRIACMTTIGLGVLFEIFSPEVFNRFGFSDPVVLWRIGSF